jgi:hypothetical protein
MEEKDLRNLALDHQRNFPEAVAARTRSDPSDSHCNSPRIRGPPSPTAQRWGAPSGWRAISVTKRRKEWRAKCWRGSQEACYPEGWSLVTRKNMKPSQILDGFLSFNWAWKEAETKLVSKSVKRLRKRHLLTGTYRCRMRIGSRSTSRPQASSTGTP